MYFETLRISAMLSKLNILLTAKTFLKYSYFFTSNRYSKSFCSLGHHCAEQFVELVDYFFHLVVISEILKEEYFLSP